MKRTEEDIKKLIELVREANTAGWVCDSAYECEGWEINYIHISAATKLADTFEFCPWCGRSLDWGNWERLKK